MRFTDKTIAALKPKAGRYEVWEGHGFGCRVTPRGGKSWVWLYRFQGKPRRMTLGPYPAMSLAKARIRLAEAQETLARDKEDPGSALVASRQAERAAETVSELVADYLEKYAKPRKRSAAEDERLLNRDVLPAWGRRKAKDIRRRDVIALLDAIVERGSPIAANRTLAVVRKMFNWAISRDLMEANPCYLVKAPGKETRRDRILSDAEIARFWHGLDTARIASGTRLALRLQLATAQRPGEVVNAEWADIDREAKAWLVPSEKAKNGMAHHVPLSALALDLLDAIKESAGNSPWLFPSPHGGKPITGGAMNHAISKNLGTMGLEKLTPHDLRRTAASGMTSIGISRLVVGKLLNHVESGVTAIYDRSSYHREKRRALDAWGNRLAAIIGGEATSNVVPLAARQGTQ